MGNGVATVSGPVLLDNTVLTNFALVGKAELVMRLWPTAACTTAAVVAEYALGAAEGLLPTDAWSNLTVVDMTDEEESFAANLSSRLGAGERTCLTVALHHQGLLVSDDLDARRAADQYQVPRTGTVGILLLCARRGLLSGDEADSLLEEMISLGYRSPVEHLKPLIDEWKEL